MPINLYGTLTIEGDRDYGIVVKQARTNRCWILLDYDFVTTSEQKQDTVVAVLKTSVSGSASGYGKAYILNRLADTLNEMVRKTVAAHSVDVGFFTKGEYVSDDSSGDYINFSTSSGGSTYMSIDMVSEGFRLNLSKASVLPKLKLPDLTPLMDAKAKSAIVAGLGIRTAAMLRHSLGDRLNFVDRKDWRMIDTNEKFEQMMLEFLMAVQAASDCGKSVLVGLDTETTGLHMYNLSPDNPARDHIVAIPFSWEDDKGFLINIDMAYFSNVDSELVFPLFAKLFSRKSNFEYQDIELDYLGHHFHFNRCAITLAGYNAMFDNMAFRCHACEIMFDDDAQILLYNLATDWVQGRNSLKEETRRLIGDETLELNELFGKKNEDKFRYLQDPLLACWYGCADADYTRLVTKKARAMTPTNLFKLYRKYDMTMLHTLAKAGYEGLPIDTQAVIEQGHAVEKDLETLRTFIYRFAYQAMQVNMHGRAKQIKRELVDDFLDDDDMSGQAELGMMDSDNEFRFKFTPANHKKLLFGILHYPVIKRDSKGQPTLDKFVRSKLLDEKRDKPAELLFEDVPSVSDPSKPLISKDEFNRLKYPLTLVYNVYAVLNKEYNSYYKPIMEHDLEGHMFYGFSMARAATRRILSPGQTMKGSLKNLVKAPKGRLFMCFDVSQMEYRLMASEARQRTEVALKAKYPDNWQKRLSETMIDKVYRMMADPEADYHIETAAAMLGIKQYQVDHDTRKKFKKVGFGIPYGLSIPSLANDLYKNKSPEAIKATTELYNMYTAKQVEIMNLLESTRDSAFVPAELSQAQREWMGIGDTYVGKVYNLAGFYRMFILTNLTRKNTSSIRRKAGNCLIQGGAAELFRRMIYNETVAFANAGLDKKITLHMVVHDEGDFTIDADCDVMQIISILYNNCVLRYEGHIPYFVGIGFGGSWAEAKDDGAELPIIMVQRMLAAWKKGEFSIPTDGNQPQYLLQLKRHYMCDRVEEELRKIIPGLKRGFVWDDASVEKVDREFENYTVRAYLDIFCKGKKPLKEKLGAWQAAREEYGFGYDFLTERFHTIEDKLEEMHLDGDIDPEIVSTDDLFIELLDSASAEDEHLETEGVQTTDSDLLDYDVLGSDMQSAIEDSTECLEEGGEGSKESEYEYNATATTAYDIFIPKKYKRTKVLRAKEDCYTIMLAGTKFDGNVSELTKEIRSHFASGQGTLVLIGSTLKKVSNIATTEEDLNWLDKLIVEQTK